MLVKNTFKGCPSPEKMDACDSVESATALLANYYKGAFKSEFTEYLNKIKNHQMKSIL